MDGTYVPLERSYDGSSSTSKECIEVAIGVTADGRRQVLDFRAVPKEGAGSWVRFPGIPPGKGRGKPEALRHGWAQRNAGGHSQDPSPGRNVAAAVRTKDRKEIAEDFKAVYSKGCRAERDEAFASFCSKRAKPHPKPVLSLFEKQDSLFAFYDLPKPMWRSIYTSNAAESLNSIAERKTRARIQYNSEDSAPIVLAKVYEDYDRDARPAKFMPELNEEEKAMMGFDC